LTKDVQRSAKAKTQVIKSGIHGKVKKVAFFVLHSVSQMVGLSHSTDLKNIYKLIIWEKKVEKFSQPS